MTTIAEHEPPTASQRVPPVVQWARGAYLLCAACFASALVVQVFFAGAGVLVDPRYFALHTAFGHLIEVVPPILLLIALIARLPWRLSALSALVYVLFMLQYVFLYLLGRVTGLPVLRALHAVNALVLFWIAVYLTQRGWQLLRSAPHRPRPATPGA